MTETPVPQAAVPNAGAQAGTSLRYGHLSFTHCPAVPYVAQSDGTTVDKDHVDNAAFRLAFRGQHPKENGKDVYVELQKKPCGIPGQSGSAYDLLYPDASGTWLALDDPSQFTLPWTPFVCDTFKDVVQPFSDSLTNATTATKNFWPMIANFGLGYNLLVLTKVDAARCAALAAAFGDAWAAEEMDALQAAGLLYEIDMTTMALDVTTQPHQGGPVRFTPGTLTVLQQDPKSKALTPVLIQVCKKNGPTKIYGATDDGNAWLYALQAAKASITAYGIWIGHVYHWHIVTAALQMTMFNRLPGDHPVRLLLEPQSQSLIDFDYVLLKEVVGGIKGWDKIAPPTPLDEADSLLALLDRFAETPPIGGTSSREFFDDDPLTSLKQRGLEAADFKVNDDWDAYPLVGFLLDIWELTQEYVTAVVNDLYPHGDTEVANDHDLTAWINASGDPGEGNVRGLPKMETRADLIAVLTSLLYRVTAHGAASLGPAVTPALSFVANFPPCLQNEAIPEPGADMSTEDLLNHLPYTGTLGGMTTFYYTFAYTPPDVPLIPANGVTDDLYFGPSHPACNDALVSYRNRIIAFVSSYRDAWANALKSICGQDPAKLPPAGDLYKQWARSIEI